MAIRLIDQYPNRVGTPDADYPHGVPRNKSAPTATDGTPYEQSWFRDQEGYFQGLLETAAITPSGTPDTVQQSDYLDALVQVASGVTEIDVSGDQDVTIDFKQARIFALKLKGALAGDIDLIVPDAERIYWIIDETTGGFSVTVRTAAGTGVVIGEGPAAVRSDGANVVDFLSIATADEAQALSSLSKVLTPGRFSSAFNAIEKQLGVDQAWQDVSGSRTAGVTYTNTTGKPIALSIIVYDASSINYIDVDGVRVGSARSKATSEDTQGFTIIPDGSTYVVTSGFDIWAELR